MKIDKTGSEEWIYIHSVKKYCKRIPALPQGVVFWKTVTGYLPTGVICEDIRKSKTVYHVHKNGGSHPPYGKFGAHDVYILKGEKA